MLMSSYFTLHLHLEIVTSFNLNRLISHPCWALRNLFLSSRSIDQEIGNGFPFSTTAISLVIEFRMLMVGPSGVQVLE